MTVEDFIREWNDPNPYIEAHTSGSTGEPKTIRLAKDDMRLSAQLTCRYFNIDRGSVLALPLSPDYIAGKMMIVRSLVSGARLIVDKPSNQPFATSVDAPAIDLIAIVPSQIDALITLARRTPIHAAIIGGAPITPAQEQLLLDSSIPSWATYGMTETCSHVALRTIRPGNARFDALPGFTFGTDTRGCLVIDHPDFTFCPVVTNDIVTLHTSTSFSWMGRVDNVINSGGIKIQPEQIERLIAPLIPSCPYIITSRQSAKWGSEAILLIEDTPPFTPADINSLNQNIRQILPPLMAPRDIILVPRLPRTPNGKLLRNRQPTI